MTVRENVFVGGPLHGQRRATTGPDILNIPTIDGPLVDYEAVEPDTEVAVKYTTYVLREIARPDGWRARVWLHEDLPLDPITAAMAADLAAPQDWRKPWWPR